MLIVWHNVDDILFSMYIVWRKSLTATTQECCKQFWTSPGDNTLLSPKLYGHLPPIMKTIKVRQTRHAGHCWRSRDELINDVLWTPSYGRTKAGRPAQTYVQQLCENTGCSPEDLLDAMNNREEWRERVRDICADMKMRMIYIVIILHIIYALYIYMYLYIIYVYVIYIYTM